MRTIRTLDTEVLFHTNLLCSLYLLENERLLQHITKLERVWIDESYLEILVNGKFLKNLSLLFRHIEGDC